MKRAARQFTALLTAVLLLLSLSSFALAEEPVGVVYLCDSVFYTAADDTTPWQSCAAEGQVYCLSGSPDGETAVKELLSDDAALYAARVADTVVIAEGMTALVTVLDENRGSIIAGDRASLRFAAETAAKAAAATVAELLSAVQLKNGPAKLLVLGVYNPFPESGYEVWGDAAAEAVELFNQALEATAKASGCSFLAPGATGCLFGVHSVATGTGSLADLMYGACPDGEGAAALGALVGEEIRRQAEAPVNDTACISAKANRNGAIVTVEYSLSGNPGISGAELCLKYDEELMNLLSVEPGLLSGLSFDSETNTVRYAGTEIRENGELFTAQFVCTESAAGSEIRLSAVLTAADGAAESLTAALRLENEAEARPLTASVSPLTVSLDLTGIGGNACAEVDGVSVPLERDGFTGTVTLNNADGKVLVISEYNTAAEDDNLRYPIALHVWRLHSTGNGCTAERLSLLEEAIQYAGVSLAAEESLSARLLCAIPGETRDALQEGEGGYSLKEYGMEYGLNGLAERSAAYLSGGRDKVLRVAEGLSIFEATADGIGLENARDTLCFRPYMVLTDSTGESITVYGGTVRRTVGYLAWRNRSAFTAGTAGSSLLLQLASAAYGEENPYA